LERLRSLGKKEEKTIANQFPWERERDRQRQRQEGEAYHADREPCPGPKAARERRGAAAQTSISCKEDRRRWWELLLQCVYVDGGVERVYTRLHTYGAGTYGPDTVCLYGHLPAYSRVQQLFLCILWYNSCDDNSDRFAFEHLDEGLHLLICIYIYILYTRM
jgi:hypothetical protein